MASLARQSFVVFIVLLIATECAASLRDHRMLFGRKRDGFLPRNGTVSMRPRSGIMGSTFLHQLLDHFEPSNPVFWQQRYHFNKQYVTTSGVSFLFIGGEGVEDGNFINTEESPIVQYAKQFGAALYALEHRFYGQSKPTTNQTLEDLKFLTSQQALEDLAYFIKYVNHNEGEPQRWVVFGGSYPGSLALWFRQKYPDLAVGGVGSSGPVLAQLDFYGYLKVVEDDIKAYDSMNPGKQLKCAEQIGAAHDSIQLLMQTEPGRKQLDDQFKVRPPLVNMPTNSNNIAFFYQQLQNIFMSAAQYGGKDYMASLCDIMTEETSQLDAVARLRKVQLYPNGNDTTSQTIVDYDMMIAELAIESWNQFSNDRSWIWQTCNEFGYFQSTDTGSNVFRSTVPVNMFLNICLDVFGMRADAVQAAIDKTNAFYGARDYYTGTNVVAPYGTYDPWHFLAKQKSVHHSVVIYEMKDATHCRDMLDANGDSDILEVQQLIQENIDRWLNGPPNSDKKVKITDKVGLRPEIVPFNPGPLNFYSEKQSKNRLAQSAALKLQQGPSRLPRSLTGRNNRYGLLPPSGDNEESDAPGSVRWPPDLKEGTVSQPFDHFNSTVPFTFQQRFWYNGKFGCPTCPNFLMIGGEGPESDRWVTNENYAWMTYAKAVGANAFLLEHRYYGKSKLTTDLKYLTSAQMLFDVAEFIEQAKLGLGLTGPWLTFGGSYSGALAAWSREWFPELIAGAVGSSGPVQAKVDFYEYLEVVERTLRSSSEACATRTAEAFVAVQELATTPQGRKQISDTFNLYPNWTLEQPNVSPEAIQNVISSLYGLFQGVVQYSGDNNALGVYNVSTLCNYMTADTEERTALDGLVDVFKFQNPNNDPISSDPKKDNKDLKDLIKFIDGHNHSVSDNDLAAVLWTWQTCNEFGYYQSTDSGAGIFGSVTPLNLFIRMCEDVFNVNMASVSTRVDQTNYQYGGRDMFKGTNVILPNGNHDPWHALGILASKNPTVLPIIIDGTAHCADMYPARDSDLDSLKQARVKILAGIKNILGGVPPNPDGSSPASDATTQPVTGTESTTAGTAAAAASCFIVLVSVFITRLL